MIKKNTSFFIKIFPVIALIFGIFANIEFVNAQATPGLIIVPATGEGRAILDPDLDGYSSAKTNGIQLGYTTPPFNDITQSELPYIEIVKPDPRADLLRGGTGGATEIVGTDAAGNNAILTYSNATNLFYRFRIDSYSKATLSYSVLIDTDGKFGFTGANADTNAVAGNPGFEIEINLQTNFTVNAFNVDGTTTPASLFTGPVGQNLQVSKAVTTAGGDPDYFYDFYIPYH